MSRVHHIVAEAMSYMEHRDACKVDRYAQPNIPCDCGLSELLDGWERGLEGVTRLVQTNAEQLERITALMLEVEHLRQRTSRFMGDGRVQVHRCPNPEHGITLVSPRRISHRRLCTCGETFVTTEATYDG